MFLYIGINTDCGLQQRKCLSAMFADIGIKNRILDHKRSLVFKTLYKLDQYPQNSPFNHFLVKNQTLVIDAFKNAQAKIEELKAAGK